MIAAIPEISPASAVWLTEARSILNNGALVGSSDEVFQGCLPLGVSLVGLSNGWLVFDFCGNRDFCGGQLPAREPNKLTEWDNAFQARQEIAYKRATYINAFNAVLHAGAQDAHYGILPQPVASPDTIFKAEKHGGIWKISGPNFGPKHREVPCQSIKLATEYFIEIYNTLDERTIEILSLIHTANTHYNDHNFSSCLVVGWSVVEALQSIIWNEFLKKRVNESGGQVLIDKNRNKILNGRDFTASIVSQILSISGEMNKTIFNKMNKSRQNRNNFVHNLKSVSANDAFAVLSLAGELVAALTNTRFRLGGKGRRIFQP